MNIPDEIISEIIKFSSPYKEKHERVSKRFKKLISEYEVGKRDDVLKYLNTNYPNFDRTIEDTFFHMNRAALMKKFDDIYMIRKFIQNVDKSYIPIRDSISSYYDLNQVNKDVPNTLSMFHVMILHVYNRLNERDSLFKSISNFDIKRVMHFLPYKYFQHMSLLHKWLSDPSSSITSYTGYYDSYTIGYARFSSGFKYKLKMGFDEILINVPIDGNKTISLLILEQVNIGEYLNMIKVQQHPISAEGFRNRIIARSLYYIIVNVFSHELILTPQVVNMAYKIINILKDLYPDVIYDIPYRNENNILLQHILRDKVRLYNLSIQLGYRNPLVEEEMNSIDI